MYDKHRTDVEIAANSAAEAAKHKKDVDACLERFRTAGEKVDRFTEVGCDQDPTSAPAPAQVVFDKAPQSQSPPKSKPKSVQLKARWASDLTTTEYGD